MLLVRQEVVQCISNLLKEGSSLLQGSELASDSACLGSVFSVKDQGWQSVA